MCDNCKKCNCNKMNAEGDTPATGNYDDKQVASWVAKYLLDPNDTAEKAQDAYVKAMVWLEDKKLPVVESSFADNKDELKVVINDPHFLEDKKNEKPGWKIAVIIILILGAAYWLFKNRTV